MLFLRKPSSFRWHFLGEARSSWWLVIYAWFETGSPVVPVKNNQETQGDGMRGHSLLFPKQDYWCIAHQSEVQVDEAYALWEGSEKYRKHSLVGLLPKKKKGLIWNDHLDKECRLSAAVRLSRLSLFPSIIESILVNSTDPKIPMSLSKSVGMSHPLTCLVRQLLRLSMDVMLQNASTSRRGLSR